MHFIIIFVVIGGFFAPTTFSTSSIPSTPVINHCDWELDTDFVVREYCDIPTSTVQATDEGQTPNFDRI